MTCHADHDRDRELRWQIRARVTRDNVFVLCLLSRYATGAELRLHLSKPHVGVRGPKEWKLHVDGTVLTSTSSSTFLPTPMTPSSTNSSHALLFPNNAGYNDSSTPWSWVIVDPRSYSARCSNCSETTPPLPAAHSSASSFSSASPGTCEWYSPPPATRKSLDELATLADKVLAAAPPSMASIAPPPPSRRLAD